MSEITDYRDAVVEIKNAILQSRYRAARMANGELLALYYGIGHYVSENTRSGKWGAGAIEAISRQLQSELSGLRGFSPTNMKNMRIFYEKWCVSFGSNRQSITDDLKKEMGVFLIRQLPTDELRSEDTEAFLRVGFTHHMAVLFKCDSTDERWYYIRKCASEFWSVESLKYHINANDYMKYGTMPSNFKLAIPNDEQASRAVHSFKDEYLLDFINVNEETDPELIDEPELHARVVDHICKFILAFGNGFCFIGSKYRVIVDEDEYFIDLLFFHRALDCLVAIELKSGEFKPSYLGQLNFYLSALDEYVKLPDENPSVGIILCKKAKKTTVEFAVRDFNKPMGVATYRLGGKIPEPYDSLVPVIDGVQEILSHSAEPEEGESE